MEDYFKEYMDAIASGSIKDMTYIEWLEEKLAELGHTIDLLQERAKESLEQLNEGLHPLC